MKPFYLNQYLDEQIFIFFIHACHEISLERTNQKKNLSIICIFVYRLSVEMNNQPSCSLEYSTETLDPLCKNQRMWPIFLLTSLITFISFQTSISIYLLIKNFCRQRSDLMSNETEHFSKFYRFRTWLNDISFGKTNLGKIFVRIAIEEERTSMHIFYSDFNQYSLLYFFIDLIFN